MERIRIVTSMKGFAVYKYSNMLSGALKFSCSSAGGDGEEQLYVYRFLIELYIR